MPFNGVALGGLAIGSVFLYSAVKGKSVLASAQAIITGKSPATVSQTTPITEISTPGSSGNTNTSSGSTVMNGTDAQNRALGQQIAANEFGWTGAQWNALDTLWGTYESGWSSTVQNASSGAAGIAQNIKGFGPGYEKGNAGEQIRWGCNYIKGRYGDPVSALRFELSHTPHWY
jgi:hypothetical protein